MKDTEDRFHQAMIEVYESAKTECGYNAVRFLSMVSEKGGLSTAKILLNSDTSSQGFTALWERKGLNFSMEAQVLKPEFASLFTEAEKEKAKFRLEQYGYKFPNN